MCGPGELCLKGWCCAIGKSSSNAAPKAGESTLCWEGTTQKLGCSSTASKPDLLRKSLLYKINKKIAWGKVWCLGFFSGIFYFFLDFLWKAAKACPPNWQQAEVTKKKEKEERKGEKNWCRRVRAREVGAQAKENELVRRCYENSRQVRRVWSKVYWCCVKKKSLRKTRTRQSISTRTTNKTHSKQCHEGSPSDTAR